MVDDVIPISVSIFNWKRIPYECTDNDDDRFRDFFSKASRKYVLGSRVYVLWPRYQWSNPGWYNLRNLICKWRLQTGGHPCVLVVHVIFVLIQHLCMLHLFRKAIIRLSMIYDSGEGRGSRCSHLDAGIFSVALAKPLHAPPQTMHGGGLCSRSASCLSTDIPRFMIHMSFIDPLILRRYQEGCVGSKYQRLDK